MEPKSRKTCSVSDCAPRGVPFLHRLSRIQLVPFACEPQLVVRLLEPERVSTFHQPPPNTMEELRRREHLRNAGGASSDDLALSLRQSISGGISASERRVSRSADGTSPADQLSKSVPAGKDGDPAGARRVVPRGPLARGDACSRIRGCSVHDQHTSR